MSKHYTLEVYGIDELSSEAREHALEWRTRAPEDDRAGEYEDLCRVQEEHEAKLRACGFKLKPGSLGHAHGAADSPSSVMISCDVNPVEFARSHGIEDRVAGLLAAVRAGAPGAVRVEWLDAPLADEPGLLVLSALDFEGVNQGVQRELDDEEELLVNAVQRRADRATAEYHDAIKAVIDDYSSPEAVASRLRAEGALFSESGTRFWPAQWNAAQSPASR